MAKQSGFHAFTFKGQTYSGSVDDFLEVEGIVEFTYRYAHDSAAVEGSFTGERRGTGEVLGTWKEVSNKPIAGESSWQGSAELTIVDGDRRRVLHGSWTMKGIAQERWIGEVG